MRFTLFILLVTGCSRTAAPVAPPAPITTAAATCGGDEPAPIEPEVEVQKPVKPVFDHQVCR